LKVFVHRILVVFVLVELVGATEDVNGVFPSFEFIAEEFLGFVFDRAGKDGCV
jgi:hypothetical protein